MCVYVTFLRSPIQCVPLERTYTPPNTFSVCYLCFSCVKSCTCSHQLTPTVHLFHFQQNDGKTSADAANPVTRTPTANAKKPLLRSQSTPVEMRQTQLHAESAKPTDIAVHPHAQSMVFEHTDHAGGKSLLGHAETVDGIALVGNELSVEKTLAPVIEVSHAHSAKVDSSAESVISSGVIDPVNSALAVEDMLASPREESLINSNLQVSPADDLLEPPVATETTPNAPSTIDPVNSALAVEDMLAPPQ